MSGAGGLQIDLGRLLGRLDRLARIGALDGGGNARLALSDEDKAARDLVTHWMRELELDVTVDAIGNIVGLWPGTEALEPVMTGSHIDTVVAGGKFDGNLGVLAGLEVAQTLREAGVRAKRGLAVAVFTNEEGVRFQPDMMGSLVYARGLNLAEALNTRSSDGTRLGDELARIGYAGTEPPGWLRPSAFVELHIEQGPVLEAEGVTIGAVRDLQGISWQEVVVKGQANHAGTTPIGLRHDAGFAAAAIMVRLREITSELGGAQVATVGELALSPGVINVIPAHARLTVDLRNTDAAALGQSERLLGEFINQLSAREGVRIEARSLARFDPVTFAPAIVDLIAEVAAELGLSHRRMTSGAGHDAQMLSRICPAAMIFVPSTDGISHNPSEFTEAADIEAGANVLLHTLLRLMRE